MATTYNYVAANKRRSVLLIIVFVAIVGLVSWVITRLLATGPAGVVIAIGIAIVMSLVGYYQGDQIALRTAQAQGPIQKNDQAYLYNLVENLCIADGLPMPAVYIIPDQEINAFATGRDPQHASLAVTIGAIERLKNEELEGVLAHELSHVKNYDVRFMTLVIILVGTLTILADFFWRSMWWGGRRRNNDNDSQAGGVLMLIGLVLLILAPILGQLMQLAVSRKREFLADASGALLTRYPEGLASALEKIQSTTDRPLTGASNATAHLYISNPFGPQLRGIAKLFSTHPPIEDRIAALRAMAN